eukprot:14356652-Alexandrium_andersonii.AAC.1
MGLATPVPSDGPGPSAEDAIRAMRANPEHIAMSDDGSLLDASDDPYEALARPLDVAAGHAETPVPAARTGSAPGAPPVATRG